MPSASGVSLPGFRRLGEGLRQLRSLPSSQPLASDPSLGAADSGSAALVSTGSHLLLNTSQINGLGGKLDLLV